MKALVKLKKEPGIWLSDIPEPEVGTHEVLIKIKKTAICGTDIHIFKWNAWAQKTILTPLTIGHEFIGEIIQVGAGITKSVAIGDRVTAEGHIVCGYCRNCRVGRLHHCEYTRAIGVNCPGVFAEYIVIPAMNVFKIPDSIGDDIASILDPLGNAIHTALSFDLVGEDVLITGAGPIGIMATAIARKVGARHIVVTDVEDLRLKFAQSFGADITVNVQKDSLSSVTKRLNITGFNVGMEMSGHPSAFQNLVKNMKHGGKVALLGILPDNTTIDWHQVIFKSLVLKGIYGREMNTWYKTFGLLESGLNIDSIITHTFPMDDYSIAFETAASGSALKVVLDWG